jgi:hypothetical protein
MPTVLLKMWQNMGALGDSDEKEDVQKDIQRLAQMAGLKVIEGGKKEIKQ